MSFSVNYETGDVNLHQGDTGSYLVQATRSSGTAWGSADRLIYSIASVSTGELVMCRAYRLDLENNNGIINVEYHNADTQDWPAGGYSGEMRAIVNAYWSISNPPTSDVVDLLALMKTLGTDQLIVDGDTVRTKNDRFTVTVRDVIGDV